MTHAIDMLIELVQRVEALEQHRTEMVAKIQHLLDRDKVTDTDEQRLARWIDRSDPQQELDAVKSTLTEMTNGQHGVACKCHVFECVEQIIDKSDFFEKRLKEVIEKNDGLEDQLKALRAMLP